VSRLVQRAPAVTLVLIALATAYGTSRRAPGVRAAEVPELPARLSETGLYEPGRVGVVAAHNRPFAPQYPLWTDGATKRRWLYLPPGSVIDATDAASWDYPMGTSLYKEFAFGGRKVETRLLWKAADDAWLVASYVWNEEQTDAVLAPERGVPGAAEIAPGRRHGVPGRADCAACHGAPARPLGFSALQLSDDRDPNAIHGEPLEPGMLTLAVLQREGLIDPAREELVRTPPRITASDPRTRAALGYLAANCGHCHDASGAITANLPSLAFADVAADGDAVARSLVGRLTRWQLPGSADGSELVRPPEPARSALVARMRSRRPSSQMPPLGTVLPDHRALAALSLWIETGLAQPRVAARSEPSAAR